MISVQDQQQVMLISWIKKGINSNNSTQRKLIDYFLRDVGGLKYISRCDTDITHFKGMNNVKSLFWRNVLTSWLKLDKSAFNNLSCDARNFDDRAVNIVRSVVPSGRCYHVQNEVW